MIWSSVNKAQESQAKSVNK